eukprot:7389971-Prymnesium_polylepis.2
MPNQQSAANKGARLTRSRLPSGCLHLGDIEQPLSSAYCHPASYRAARPTHRSPHPHTQSTAVARQHIAREAALRRRCCRERRLD